MHVAYAIFCGGALLLFTSLDGFFNPVEKTIEDALRHGGAVVPTLQRGEYDVEPRKQADPQTGR
jgi:hypothetical protein